MPPPSSYSMPPTPNLDRFDHTDSSSSPKQQPKTSAEQTSPSDQQPTSQHPSQSSQHNMPAKSNSTQSLSTKQNLFVWNGVTIIDNPNQQGKKITIDRRSWITRYDEQTSQMTPVHYALDKLGYPRYLKLFRRII